MALVIYMIPILLITFTQYLTTEVKDLNYLNSDVQDGSLQK